MRGVEQNQNQKRNNDLPRSRALGIITLMFALLLFQVGVFLFDKVFRGERQEAGPSAAASSVAASSVAASSTAARTQLKLFQFDPNTICPDSLCLLGFSRKQAESIIKYRNKGGKFRKKSDLAKMYVVSQEKYLELEPYIVIPEPTHQEATRQEVPRRNPSRLQADGSSVVPDSLHVHSPQPPLLIDINAADSAAFTRLYGIGGYYARKIIEYRERLGNFYSTAQLMEIPGIDSVRFNGFAKRVTADPAAVRSFSLDTAGKYFLARHPYVGAYAARGILLMREKFGAGACTIENLVKERILSPQIAEKLRHYISGSSF